MKSFLFGGEVSGPLIGHLGLAALRVMAGLSMAFGHGLSKLPPPDRFVSLVKGLGLPLPEFFAWAAGLSEFVGGILLAVGLMTRPAAILIALTMTVAVFGHHADDPWGRTELAALFGSVAVCFACTGSGRFGFDHIVKGG